jgi:molybdopterin molybdotransferase
LIEYAEAIERVRAHCLPLPAETVALSSGEGRFLAEDVRARLASPAFDNSAVDGFALGTGEGRFRIVAAVRAGSGTPPVLGAGQAVRIYTGAPVPAGTNAIAMIEDCQVDGDTVLPTAGGDHIRGQGEDYAEGATIAYAGDLISPPLAALLASAGAAEIAVHRLPRVTLLTSGDELVPVGAPLGEGKIYNSNAIALDAALRAIGISPVPIHVADDLSAVRQSVEGLLSQCDVLISCGGISVGEHDHLKAAFQAAGVEEVFWRASIKPGKPIFFGARGKQLVFGLPGNPVSSLVTFFLFARPALLSLMGCRTPFTKVEQATLSARVSKEAGRTEFRRGALTSKGGRMSVAPAVGEGSHLLLGTGHANCLFIFSAASECMEAGERVDVLPLKWGLL